MFLNETKKWLEDKPKFAALFAVYVALLPEIIYKLYSILYSGNEDTSALKPKNLKSWLKLYKQHRVIVKCALGNFPGLSEFEYNHIAQIVLNKIKSNYFLGPADNSQLAIMQAWPKEQWEIIMNSLYDYLFAGIDNLAYQLAETRLGRNQSENDSIEFSEELLFVLRLWGACWVIYGEAFTVLLRKARQGDLDAIQKLLIVDKNAIFEPGIARIWSKCNDKPDSEEFQTITKALKTIPKIANYDATKAKYDVAGMIARVFAPCKKPIPASEIGALFNALAKDLSDKSKPCHIDADLDNHKSDAFRKRVVRAKSHWDKFSLFDPDK